jgi:hypothetical protein
MTSQTYVGGGKVVSGWLVKASESCWMLMIDKKALEELMEEKKSGVQNEWASSSPFVAEAEQRVNRNSLSPQGRVLCFCSYAWPCEPFSHSTRIQM